jgi:hypothetical protein
LAALSAAQCILGVNSISLFLKNRFEPQMV